MLDTQALEVNDFSGGIVDDYINAPAKFCETSDNIDCIENRSLLMRPGSIIDNDAVADDQIPAGTQKIRTLINYKNSDTLLVHSAKKLYYRNPSSYATLSGPTGNDAFSLGDVNSCVAHTQWKGHLFVTNNDFAKVQKIYKDSSNILRIRSAGLPALASSPVITPGVVGARNYVYAFHYYYTYTVGLETFEDAGPVTLVEVANSGDPFVNPNAISVIPVLSNGATGNWDTTVIKVKIFRSIDAGTTYYEIGEVTNGTTTFNDNFADSAISDDELVIYTEGGIVDNEEPPLAKYIHVVQNRMYYAHIKEGLEVLPSDVRQSIDGDPDSVPATFSDTVEDEITGISSVNENPIVLCKKHIYRIEGSFDEFGRGVMVHTRIHDTAGCISHNSCVQAEQGLFWAGNDGFWYTDGYRTFKVSDHINRKYKAFVDAAKATGDLERVTGIYDEKNRKIIWAVQQDSASLDNDSCFTLDLRYGVSEVMPFRTWSGSNVSFRPTSIVFFNNLLYRADTRGYVLIHSDEYTTDPKIDPLLNAEDWVKETIIWRYKSPASNFGSNFVRKWVPRILLTAKNRSNISIQINVINDDGKFTRELTQIRYRNNFVWGDTEFVWRNEDCVWNAEGLIEEWRRLPRRGLRCSYLQVEVTNAYTVITNSDTIGQATVNTALNTVTLDSFATADWPIDAADYYLSFESDNYTQQYLITARTDDTVTVADPNNTLPSGSQKWLLKGYKKNEVLNLLSFTVHYAMLSKTQTNEGGANVGANA